MSASMLYTARTKLQSIILHLSFTFRRRYHFPINLEQWNRVRHDAAFFRSLKNLYEGQPAFVIGNGPSLRIEDLNALNGKVTIAANKIFLAFAYTDWRPTFATIADPILYNKTIRQARNNYSTLLIPHYLLDENATAPNVKVFRTIGGAPELRAAQITSVPFSGDLSRGAYTGYTVTYENLQFAVHLGSSPIYLIGCDHYYKGESDTVANLPVTTKSADNHFVPNYRSIGETVNPAPLDLMNVSYQTARLYSEQHGINIYNATRGGHLDVFERVNLDSILK